MKAGVIAKYLFLLPLFFFFGVVLYYQVNFPFYDDYQTILNPVIQYRNATGFSEKMAILFQPQNEHRVALSTGFTLFSSWVTGKVDFNVIRIFGNLSYVLIIFLFWKNIKKITSFSYRDQWLVTLTVSLLLFNFQGWENNFWGMPAVSNFWVIALAFLCFHFYVRNQYVNALLAGLAASFTNGNGMLVFAVIFAIELLKKDFRKALLSLGLFLIVFLLYQSGSGMQETGHKAGNMLQISGFFLAFLGNNFGFPGLLIASVTVGIAMLGLLFIAWTKYRKDIPEWLFFAMVFVVATAAVTALKRSNGGVLAATPSRYKIYGSLVLIFLYLMSSVFFKKARVKNVIVMGGLVFALLFNAGNFWLYRDKIQFSNELRLADQFRIYHGIPVSGSPDPAACKAIFDQSYKLHLFQPKDSVFRLKLTRISGPLEPASKLEYHLDSVYQFGNSIAIPGWVCNAAKGANFTRPELVFSSAGNHYILPVYRQKNYRDAVNGDVNLCVDGGFFALFDKSDLPAGIYDIGVFLHFKNGNRQFTPTAKKLILK